MTARIIPIHRAAEVLGTALDEVARLDGSRTWQGPGSDRFRRRREAWQRALRDDADRLAALGRATGGGPPGPEAA